MTQSYKKLADLVVWQALRIRELEKAQVILQDYLDQYQCEEIDLSILESKSHSEVSKLKVFIEAFNVLAGEENKEVDMAELHSDLMSTGRFSHPEIETYMRKAKQNGQIYETRQYFCKKT